VREREQTYKRRLDTRLDEELRKGRKEIDTIIEGLRARTADLSEQAARRAGTLNTGESGSARAEARAALDRVVGRLKTGPDGPATASQQAPGTPSAPIEPGVRVLVGALGLEGTVLELHGTHAEIDVQGKRLRAPTRDLRVIGSRSAPSVRVTVDLQPREGRCTVDEAVARVEKFLDESTVSDQQTIRIIHGHGTGQLRRGLAAFLKEHPLVAKFEPAPANQGGGGVTVVELKE
jgi:DNA mismatch repair protein MutS2